MPLPPALVRRRCFRSGGVARTSELAASGIDRSSLARAVADGEIVRLREGVYAVPDLPVPVQTAIRHGGALGCLSRVHAAGLWVLEPPETVHVSMPRTGRRRRHEGCRCVTHWSRAPATEPRASLEEALLQLHGCRGSEEFFVALESAMRKRFLTKPRVAALRARLPAKHRWLVDFARWNADSGLESLLRLRLRSLGLELRSQVRVPGVGRVDFVLGDRVILEADGKANHVDAPDSPSSASKRHKDLVRDAAAAALGFETLRFDYALIVHDWPTVEAAILALVAGGRHLDARVAR
ncbi:type IV toxin-antitoxin system AbiEi family antitoxin domain-containing protein [Agromyces mediolanus]|uniref:type IV toxin-antitoxin system AbiEi family antitoxin domain-containing protein n=1 Tax=Agromyces mediolanus TaxID=41986 RepID=UPI00203EDA60|nr:type IV toxin-antitoxin system AbiEi family antitoxin domain-containing protein [Agromyces mediolanus]MCM3656784.1 type IV toxin-antitoxin system AbiEi family antitoxin domain-containing protein [Agromyces mediolanus]